MVRCINVDGNNNDSISDGVDVSTWIDLSGAGNNGTAQSTKVNLMPKKMECSLMAAIIH